MFRAISCNLRYTTYRSSFKLILSLSCCSITKQLRSAAIFSTDKSLKTPFSNISVRTTSSPTLISHATRPLTVTISSSVKYPIRRRTLLRCLRSSKCKMDLTLLTFFFKVLILARSATFFPYSSYSDESCGVL